MGYNSPGQDPQYHRAQGLAGVCRKLTIVMGGELEKRWQGPKDHPSNVSHKHSHHGFSCSAQQPCYWRSEKAKPGFWGIKWFSTRSHIRITCLQSILQ